MLIPEQLLQERMAEIYHRLTGLSEDERWSWLEELLEASYHANLALALETLTIDVILAAVLSEIPERRRGPDQEAAPSLCRPSVIGRNGSPGVHPRRAA